MRGNTRFLLPPQESFQSRGGGLDCGACVPVVPTKAINSRLEHLDGSALGFRNFTTASPDHSWKPAASDSGYTPRVAGGTFTDMTAKVKKVKEQNLAVFGESGSGKTVLLSSFYGASQEPSFRAESLYTVLADDIGQGTRLRQNYLLMRNQAEAPKPSRFTATPYSFTLKLKDPGDAKSAKAKPFNALRLVWHDYPGEWFTQDPSSAEEADPVVGVDLTPQPGARLPSPDGHRLAISRFCHRYAWSSSDHILENYCVRAP